MRPVLWVVLALILAGSLVYGIVLTDEKPAFAYFSTFARAWELGLGAALALLGDGEAAAARRGRARLGRPRRDRLRELRLHRRNLVPGDGGAGPDPRRRGADPLRLGARRAARAGSKRRALGPAAVLGLAPVRYVGRISYSWYLWHWPALVFAAAIWGPRLSVAAGLAAVAASWIPTPLTHMLIEDPVRRAPTLARLPNRAIALGLACTVVALGVGIGLRAAQPTVRTAPLSDVPGAAALLGHRRRRKPPWRCARTR